MQICKNKALEISVISVLFNLSMTLLKLIAGVVGNSYALVSDAIHSLADVMSSVIVAAGIFLSGKRFEFAAAVIVAVILLVTGVTLGVSSFTAIVTGDYKTQSLPSTLAVIVSAVPIVAKEIMYRFEEKKAKELRSAALHADALHHRADEFVSIGVLVGVAGGYFGYEIIDVIAGFIVALLIVKASVEIFIDARRITN